MLRLLATGDPLTYAEAISSLTFLQHVLTALQKNAAVLRINESLRNQRQKFLTVLDDQTLQNELRSVENELQIATSYKLKRIYIPMLRGLRPIPGSTDDFYKTRTIIDYFPGDFGNLIDSGVAPHNVISGLGYFEQLRQHLLGSPTKRKRIADYQKLLSKEFFEGKEVTLIPEHGNDVVSVMIGNGEQLPIFKLGDGLQQIIIITFAAFMSDEPAQIFIEEPEISLHPGMQRRLMEFLLAQTEHQYYITTHSNHFLDLADTREDVNIFRIRKKAEDALDFELTSCEAPRSLLLELGVKPSSVYLANSTIWVEGLTDRLYLQTYLKKFLEELPDSHPDKKIYQTYKENFHYAFVEYQGGNLVHWDFESDTVNHNDPKLHAIKVAAHGIVIADSDVKGKADREKWLITQLGDRIIFTSGKEIDNMLPLNVLQNTVKKIFSGKHTSETKALIQDIDLIDSLTDKYQKSSSGIGKIIDKHLGISNPERLFSTSSGTINNKVKFCETAIKIMSDRDQCDWQLTEDLRAMCKTIFQHIKSCND